MLAYGNAGTPLDLMVYVRLQLTKPQVGRGWMASRMIRDRRRQLGGGGFCYTFLSRPFFCPGADVIQQQPSLSIAPDLAISPSRRQARITKLGMTIDLHSIGLVAKSSVYELFNITLQRVCGTVLQTPGEYSLIGIIQAVQVGEGERERGRGGTLSFIKSFAYKAAGI